MLKLVNVSAGYKDNPVLNNINLSFSDGSLTALVGRNGCGKSTLIKTIGGIITPLQGIVEVDGKKASEYEAKEFARHLSYLPQSRNIPDITAERLVIHGRFPYLSYPRRYTALDRRITCEVLKLCGADIYASKPVAQLSGGQRQKVYLAMLLAQQAGNMLLDEPTVSLDISSQEETMELARSQARQGRCVIAVIHDLCMALKYADRIVLIDGATVAAEGSPQEIYESGVLDKVMGVKVRRTEDGCWYYA